MTGLVFFKSRSFKYGSLAGMVAFLAGTGGSAAIALYVASKCTFFINLLEAKIATDLTIPEVTGVINMKGYNLPVTLHDITAVIPPNWIDTFDKYMEESSDYCFQIPFVIGLSITLAYSLALASMVAFVVHNHELPKENEETREDYMILPAN